MLVTGDRLVRGRDLAALCQAAERGGVTSIQVRLQEATSRELAAAVRAVLAAVQVPVLVNGRADVAIACRAAGVHLGPEDVPAPLIRRIAPMGFIIGASVGTAAEVENGRGADYWGVGPWNSSGSTPDAGLPLGPVGFAAIVRRAEGRPCIASGGIRPEDVPEVIRAGGGGVAVASGILGLAEVEQRARAYRQRHRHDEPG
jgi:thiamine-phosphate pyrophosphorylase